MTSHTVVVGTGYVGRRFCELHEGDITGLNRPAFDLDSEVVLPDLPTPFDVLYTVAPANDSPDDTRLARFLAALDPAPARFVYISTTGVYGNRDGAGVDEESAVNPETDRAQRRVSAETMLAAHFNGTACALVILRVPGIYGPGRLGIERVEAGIAVLREQDAGPGNRIHVDDLVACCEAGLSPATPAGIYNVGDGDERSSVSFSNEVARQCGLKPPPTLSMAEAEREFSPMRLSFLREKRRVSTKKMRDVLGVTPKYANAEDGIAASLPQKSP